MLFWCYFEPNNKKRSRLIEITIKSINKDLRFVSVATVISYRVCYIYIYTYITLIYLKKIKAALFTQNNLNTDLVI